LVKYMDVIRLRVIYWLLQYAGLSTKLAAAAGHYIVFAPNDNVFTGLPQGTVDYFRSTEVRPLQMLTIFFILEFFYYLRLLAF